MENGEEDGPGADDPFDVSGGVWVPDVECGLQLREYVQMPLSQFFDHLSLVSEPPQMMPALQFRRRPVLTATSQAAGVDQPLTPAGAYTHPAPAISCLRKRGRGKPDVYVGTEFFGSVEEENAWSKERKQEIEEEEWELHARNEARQEAREARQKAAETRQAAKQEPK